jgi:hypothetical protein
MNPLSRDDVIRVVQAIRKYHDQVGQFLKDSGHLPAADSKGLQELNSFVHPESVSTAFSQGTILIEVAADNLMAFTKTVAAPIQSIAPWVCVRAVIEASALATWLLDPTADAKERVQRSLALRYEGLSQQVKFGQAAGVDGADSVFKRIEEVEHLALSLGFSALRDRRGKRSGIGQPMPSMTELIAQNLDEEAAYRLLSAMAHGHHWALIRLGFRETDEQATLRDTSGVGRTFRRALEKNLSPTNVLYLATTGFQVFSKPIKHLCTLYGWDSERLEAIHAAASATMGLCNE